MQNPRRKDQLDWDHRWHELETLVAPTEAKTPAIMIASCLLVELELHFIVHTVVSKTQTQTTACYLQSLLQHPTGNTKSRQFKAVMLTS